MFALPLTGLALAIPTASAQDHLDPATGYRIEQYRAPTPQTVPGGTLVTLEALQDLVLTRRAVLIDVTPSQGAGPDPKTGTWLLPKQHMNMPGTHWLPDVGRGALTATLDAYYQSNLTALTGSDKSRPIVIYCQADCWMSWNAVKRAASYGYTTIYWYPDGTGGMRDWDIPLAPATPVPLPR